MWFHFGKGQTFKRTILQKKLIVNIIRVMKCYKIEKGIHSKGIDYFTGNYSYLRNF